MTKLIVAVALLPSLLLFGEGFSAKVEKAPPIRVADIQIIGNGVVIKRNAKKRIDPPGNPTTPKQIAP